MVSLPDLSHAVSVDDVVVTYKSGRRRFIQTKKNQPKHGEWRLTDKTLQEELCKACDQIETSKDSIVEFYSRSPFGVLRKLAEECRSIYSEYQYFLTHAPDTLRQPLKKLSEILDREEDWAHQLVQQIEFGPSLDYTEWDKLNQQALNRLVIKPDAALAILDRFVRGHQSGLRDAKLKIVREDVISELHKHGLFLTPQYSEKDILDQFKQASSVGRQFQRTIAGENIKRPEQSHLIKLIQTNEGSILVTDRPGSGKTCLLLNLADYIEQSTSWGLLFIKGDLFSGIKSEADLTVQGMPQDIVNKCAYLAASLKVVVIIDSLDVLALNREHGALQVFLSLLDRLEQLSNVTVISACRSFDLEYDPLLRERQWGEIMHIGDLDFETVVQPLLIKWGVNLELLPDELKKMLGLPQNLRLFAGIANRAEPYELRTPFQLQEAFIEEIIVKDSKLGQKALSVLHNTASYLVQNRVQSMPKSALSADEEIIQRLISQEVLALPRPGRIAFSHQVLLDAFVVRGSLSEGKKFVEFVMAYPPFPFIRPFVRTFLFYLRAHCPDEFSRQTWEVLSSNAAYHLRRLVAESLAEIEIGKSDWPMIQRLFNQTPDLFRRLFWRAKEECWFKYFSDQWLPSVLGSPNDKKWRLQFVDKLRIWMNTHPEKVISFWQEALSKEWCEGQNPHWAIINALGKFEKWNTVGIRELLDILVDESEEEHILLGIPLSLYVQATNQGDSLLWRFITKQVEEEDVSRSMLGNKLKCNSHEFYDKHFLKNRLKNSTTLIDLALNALESWSSEAWKAYGDDKFRSAFLHSSSWEKRHSQHDTYHADALTMLLDGVQSALDYHAQGNDQWWQANEPKLRHSREETLRYFLILAYQHNVQTNIVGIEAILQDPDLFRYSRLEWELGQLMRAAYPSVSDEVQEINQNMILNLYAEEVFEGDTIPLWSYRHLYKQLIWIPLIFRTQETQNFIEQWQNEFGPERPGPTIYGRGGWVKSPINMDSLLALTDTGLLRLFWHYNNYNGWSEYVDEGLVGGRSQIETLFRDCCSRNPNRYKSLLTVLIDEGLYIGYISALIDGLANHLRYRFGNLQPPKGWQATDPESDGIELASVLLEFLERYSIIWEDGRTVANALQACCHVLLDENLAQRLTFLLFQLVRHKDPEKDKQVLFRDKKEGLKSEDLGSIAINSVRGIAAESAMILCNRLLEHDNELPELLPPLLRHFARDPVSAVRVSILQRLPYLIYKQHGLGWRLMADVFREPQTHLWEFAERSLYYQYRDHFDKVRPYLNRLFQEAHDIAGEAWGRIATLASMSGHISYQNLFDDLKAANNELCWKGATQVLTANLSLPEQSQFCEAGLLEILDQEKVPNRVLNTIERGFGIKTNQNCISVQIAQAFIKAIPIDKSHLNLFNFLDWLSIFASRDPVSVLSLTEELANKLITIEPPPRLTRTEPLIAVLVSILREADETGDPELIRRAIGLQDRFLQMDLHGIEKLFNQST